MSSNCCSLQACPSCLHIHASACMVYQDGHPSLLLKGTLVLLAPRPVQPWAAQL